MVYIHGGSYETGSPFIHPSDILALQGVVVVVIQYRPDPFGFLTIGDSVSSGYYGSGNTKVQRVKSNMKHFGGNPSKVAFLTQAQADLVWVFICYLLCQRTFSIKPL